MKIVLLLFFAVVVNCFYGCSSVTAANSAAGTAEKKVKFGLYVDTGASGNGVFHLASLIEHSPQAELKLLMADDIRQGRLKDVDVLIMPGGRSGKQCLTIGTEHLEKIREFLRSGGGYVGTCAGMFDVLEHQMQLLPFARYTNEGGSTAYVSVEISEEGAKILGIKPGTRVVRYSGGPIVYKLENSKSEGRGISLGEFKSSVNRHKNNEGKFIGSPALIYGTYGKGRIAAISFHPEYWESTHDIMLGCFYAASGVKLTPHFPRKNFRPVRVGILTTGMVGREPIETMLKLERHPDIDLDYVMKTELNQGILNHLDILVMPHSNKAIVKKYLSARQLEAFMDRGGKVISTGDTSDGIPAHKNFIKLSPDADINKYIQTLCLQKPFFM